MSNDTPTEKYNLSLRTTNCLRNAYRTKSYPEGKPLCASPEGVTTMEELASIPMEQLLRIPNFGARSRDEVKDALHVWEVERAQDKLENLLEAVEPLITKWERMFYAPEKKAVVTELFGERTMENLVDAALRAIIEDGGAK